MQSANQPTAPAHRQDKRGNRHIHYQVSRRFTGKRSLLDVLIHLIKAHS